MLQNVFICSIIVYANANENEKKDDIFHLDIILSIEPNRSNKRYIEYLFKWMMIIYMNSPFVSAMNF